MKRLSIKKLFASLLTVAVLVLCALSADAFAEGKKKKNGNSSETSPRQMTDFTAKKTDSAAQTPAEAVEATPKKAEPDLYAYERPEVEESSYGWLFFKTVFILVLFALGFYFFYKYVTKKAGLSSVGSGVANILSVVPIGQNKFIHVVDLGGRVLVLGVTDGSISLITELKEKDEIERIRLQSSKSIPVEHQGFQDFVNDHLSSLIGFIGKTRKGLEKKKSDKRIYEEEYIDEDHIDYLRNQRERLRRINGHDGDKNGR